MKICILSKPLQTKIYNKNILLVPGEKYEDDSFEVKNFSYAFAYVEDTKENKGTKKAKKKNIEDTKDTAGNFEQENQEVTEESL